ncbi:hypothetical protein S245_063923, partial [Arachis hypogaea]
PRFCRRSPSCSPPGLRLGRASALLLRLLRTKPLSGSIFLTHSSLTQRPPFTTPQAPAAPSAINCAWSSAVRVSRRLELRRPRFTARSTVESLHLDHCRLLWPPSRPTRRPLLRALLFRRPLLQPSPS